jgi:hypothetical protein
MPGSVAPRAWLCAGRDRARGCPIERRRAIPPNLVLRPPTIDLASLATVGAILAQRTF